MEASPWWGKTGVGGGAPATQFDTLFKLDRGRLMPNDPAFTPAFLFRWQVTLERACRSAKALDMALRPRSFALDVAPYLS